MDRIQYEAKIWDMFYKALEPKEDTKDFQDLPEKTDCQK